LTRRIARDERAIRTQLDALELEQPAVVQAEAQLAAAYVEAVVSLEVDALRPLLVDVVERRVDLLQRAERVARQRSAADADGARLVVALLLVDVADRFVDLVVLLDVPVVDAGRQATRFPRYAEVVRVRFLGLEVRIAGEHDREIG